jgi:hypothetical protein
MKLVTHPRKMLQAAELAGNARESGRHDVLMERGKRERQLETAERQSQLAGRRPHVDCANIRWGRRPGAGRARIGLRQFHERCAIDAKRKDMDDLTVRKPIAVSSPYPGALADSQRIKRTAPTPTLAAATWSRWTANCWRQPTG